MKHWPGWLRGVVLVVAFVLIGNGLNLVMPHLVRMWSPSMDGMPDVVLWAWERPEDLRFLDPEEAGIAVLLGHIFIEGEGEPRLERRKQPLLLTPKTPLMAVVRIEAKKMDGNPLQADQTVEHMMRVFDDAVLKAVQIDFDAGEIDRAFYSMILSRLRGKLPKRMPITMTALASWCEGDRWIGGLPVDEAVPMLFRMGPDAEEIRRQLNRGEVLTEPLCRTSLGLSTDESLQVPPRWRGRIYLFHPKPWTKDAYDAALETLR
ncbi:MAG: DUF3142 domain-containing protein [Acidobacteria bacterium]|nr:DUF3142 domain-containing protein [Acidobacteriota bacterium]